MNFTQMQERLRVELLRRRQRGTFSVSLLARQTGLGRSHLSNFLLKKRQLSLEAMDRVLMAQQLTAADLLPVNSPRSVLREWDEKGAVPLVSHATALYEPWIRPSLVQRTVSVNPEILQDTRARPGGARQGWQRFVAVSIDGTQAAAMEPVVSPGAIVLLDRHYTRLAPYRSNRPNLYAVRNGDHIILRYLEFAATRLVLRPYQVDAPLHVLEIKPDATLADWIAGRIALVMNPV